MSRTVSLVRRSKPARTIELDARPHAIEIDINRTAVIVIDMQNDFVSPGGWYEARGISAEWVKPLYPVINAMTALARREGIPVIWLNWGIRPDLLNIHPYHRRLARPSPGDPGYEQRTSNGKGPVLERESWGAAIAPELTVAKDDIHVAKHRFSGFWDNELDSVLRNLDVNTLLIMGINLDRCVAATVQDACSAGYDPILLEDATGTYSPQFCTDATLYLIERIYGFVSSSKLLTESLSQEG